eukprot:gnl/TRDRNA2_/TRDRNA2_156836_c0_seq2.p1 gnl/TRDRNA2_/TRDRNA2_156836_c0~~gnl/TRDRNA2_/TRDRNA2_156836_c0_seq2.p1  ORF type:complete len:273 (+),score=52.40 gnl/TRDRNA2_/TRDRNA2_156836_c0_seq2:83-901(+)
MSTNQEFLNEAYKTNDFSGSAALVMLAFGPDVQQRVRLVFANCGDSRAVLGKVDGVALRLTKEIKPNDEDELERIELAGGRVEGFKVFSIDHQKGEGDEGVHTSRSIGLKRWKTWNSASTQLASEADLVSAEPQVSSCTIHWEDYEFLILATRGIWRSIKEFDAVSVVQESLRNGADESQAAEELCRMAELNDVVPHKRTAIVIRFGWLAKKNGTNVSHASLDADKDRDEPDQAGQEIFDDSRKRKEQTSNNTGVGDGIATTDATPKFRKVD